MTKCTHPKHIHKPEEVGSTPKRHVTLATLHSGTYWYAQPTPWTDTHLLLLHHQMLHRVRRVSFTLSSTLSSTGSGRSRGVQGAWAPPSKNPAKYWSHTARLARKSGYARLRLAVLTAYTCRLAIRGGRDFDIWNFGTIIIIYTYSQSSHPSMPGAHMQGFI